MWFVLKVVVTGIVLTWIMMWVYFFIESLKEERQKLERQERHINDERKEHEK